MREIKLLWLRDIGRKEMSDGRMYLLAEFKCQICQKIVQKIKRDGLAAKFCSHKCYALNRGLRGAYKSGQVLISGYLYTYSPTHPNCTNHGYVATHRLVAENNIGRLLTDDEIAHHINEIKFNNSPDNIQVLTRSEHSKHHLNFRKCKAA